MSSHRPLLDQVFILRFWRETADASEHDRWRVLVRNINTRRRDVVDDVQCAFAIVASNLNAAAGDNDKLELFEVEPQIPSSEGQRVRKANHFTSNCRPSSRAKIRQAATSRAAAFRVRAVRIAGLVAGCLGVGLLLGGCDPTQDARYYREGIGTELYWNGLPVATQLQDAYLANMCAQAVSPTARSVDVTSCDGLSLKSRDWGLLVQAGMNDIDTRCDAYLSWLYDRKSSREPFLKELAALGGASAAILKITEVGPTPIALTAIAFGIAADTFTNVDLRLVNAVDYTTVNSVVRGNRTLFRANNLNLVIDNRPAAIYVLRNYLSICVPDSIEMSINNTINVYHRGGAAALQMDMPIGLRNPAATSSTSAAVRGTPIIRAAQAPLPPIQQNPIIVSPTRLNDFERRLNDQQIDAFQQAVCVVPTHDLGPSGSETRTKIKAALNASDELLTNRKAIELRRILRAGPAC